MKSILFLLTFFRLAVYANMDFASDGIDMAGLIPDSIVPVNIELDSIIINVKLNKNSRMDVNVVYTIKNHSDSFSKNSFIFIDGSPAESKEHMLIVANEKIITYENLKIKEYPKNWMETLNFKHPIADKYVLTESPIKQPDIFNPYIEEMFKSNDATHFTLTFTPKSTVKLKIDYETIPYKRFNIEDYPMNFYSYLLEPAKRWYGKKYTIINITKDPEIKYWCNICGKLDKQPLELDKLEEKHLNISFAYIPLFHFLNFGLTITYFYPVILIIFLILLFKLYVTSYKFIQIFSLCFAQVLLFQASYNYYYWYIYSIGRAYDWIFNSLTNVILTIIIFSFALLVRKHNKKEKSLAQQYDDTSN